MGLTVDDPTLSHTSVAPNTSDTADKQTKKDAKKARKLASEETGDAAAQVTGEDGSEIKVDTPANGKEVKLSNEERKRVKKEKKRKAREEEEEAPANAEQPETSAPVAAAEEQIDEPAKEESKKNEKSSSEVTPANGEEEKLSKEERKRIKKEKKRKVREEEGEVPANAEQPETSAPVAAAEEQINEPAKEESKKNEKSSSEVTPANGEEEKLSKEERKRIKKEKKRKAREEEEEAPANVEQSETSPPAPVAAAEEQIDEPAKEESKKNEKSSSEVAPANGEEEKLSKEERKRIKKEKKRKAREEEEEAPANVEQSETSPPAPVAAAEEQIDEPAKKKSKKNEKSSSEVTPANGEEEKLSKEERKRIKKEKKRKAREEEEEAPANVEQSETSPPAPVAAAEDQIDEPAKKKSKKNKKSSLEVTSSSAASTGPAAAISSSSSDIDSFLSANRITFEPTNAKDLYPPVLSFAALPIEDGLRKGLSGYAKPTPIQSASFPVMMGGRDVVGIAETGSGKTVAFGVPAIQHILSLPPHPASKGKKPSPPPVSVLVVAPTRELAMQTHANLASVTSALPSITSVCIYGGVPKDSQKTVLRTGARIVVGTPGRLLDLANEGVLDLGQVSWLVLDEADRMLDKGFENDIREIIAKCLPLPEAPLPKIAGAGQGQEPKARMTCMFSATWPTSVRRLASDFMCSPIRITVGNDELTANVRVSQSVIVLPDSRQKEQRLLSVLSQHGFTKGGVKKGGAIGKDREKALIFALYKKEATRVMEFLERQGYEVGCIQGDMTQERRTKSLEDFKDGRVQLLVATDVAARGLDIPKVELVVNQTFPLTIEDYIHRIGRTGRAGRTGISVTFFTEADKAHAGELIRVLKDGGHEVPEGMYQWGTTIKKQTHSTYGDFYREDIKGTSKKIRFD